MSTAPISSVLIASVQSVAKVLVIGGVGWASVKFPKNAPLLPHSATSILARLSFHTLVLPLIFATIAQAVTYDTMSQLWFVLVATVVMILLSYVSARLLGYAMNLHKDNDFALYFDALCVSAAFPNIVALPILIFPSLCEYAVVYESFAITTTTSTTPNNQLLRQECIATSNAMIFVAFFAWSFLFWSLGSELLMRAASQRQGEGSTATELQEEQPPPATTFRAICVVCKHTFSSPGFIAMILGFITGCIPPLRDALFSAGGAMRWLGAAMDTLGAASSPISTMVVAASLVPEVTQDEEETSKKSVVTDLERESHSSVHVPGIEADSSEHTPGVEMESCNYGDPENSIPPLETNKAPQPLVVIDESPIMSDPNFGPLRQRHRPSLVLLQTIRRRSTKLVVSTFRQSDPQMRKLHIWFSFSKLIVSPAIICGLMISLECGGVLVNVPPMAKLVTVINSALPGALIVVVLLKSNPALSDTAAVVANMYLPSYLLSVVTLAAWTVVGLWISIPREDGASFCNAR